MQESERERESEGELFLNILYLSVCGTALWYEIDV